MFPFGKSAQQKRIDALAAENAALRNGMEGADATAVMYSDMLADARRENETTRTNLTNALASEEHWQIEASRLTGELASARAQLKVFTDRRDRATKNLKQYQPKPNGTAAAVQGAL
jgi:chromosome segregation ATPase